MDRGTPGGKQCAVGSSYPRIGVSRFSRSARAHGWYGSRPSGGSTTTPRAGGVSAPGLGPRVSSPELGPPASDSNSPFRSGFPSAVRRTDGGAVHGLAGCGGGANGTGGFDEFAPRYH